MTRLQAEKKVRKLYGPLVCAVEYQFKQSFTRNFRIELYVPNGGSQTLGWGHSWKEAIDDAKRNADIIVSEFVS
jgi:hypothetical protein